MSGYSTSVRFQPTKLADVQGLVRHEARSVDPAEVAHSNPAIVAARTGQNVVWVSDGQGGFREATSVDEWMQAIEDRLAAAQNYRTLKDGRRVPVAMRKDAIAVVDCVFMLDPDYTGKVEDMTEEQRADATEKLGVMVQTMIDKVGAKNVVGWTIHWDETHPHVQMMVVPVDEQNRLRWKSFIDGPQALGAFHDVFREDLRAAGYDATAERVDGGKRHLGLAEYKRRQDAKREQDEHFRNQRDQLDAIAKDVKPKWAALDERAADLDEREAQLKADREQLDAERAEMPELRRRDREAAREEGRAEGRAEYADQIAATQKAAQEARDSADRADQARVAAEAAQKAMWAEVDRLEQIPAEFDQFLDLPDANGKTLRPRYERAIAPNRERRRDRVQRVIEEHTDLGQPGPAGQDEGVEKG